MKIDTYAYVHPNAVVIGNVEIGPGSSIWPGAVLRGDYNSIRVGSYSSIQDNAVLHSSPFKPVKVGDWTTVGHSVVIHGAIVADNVLVGMRSVLLDGVVVGSGTLIAAGSLIPEGTQVPQNSFVSGSPAVIKPARGGTLEKIRSYALTYHLLSRRYMKGVYTFPLEEIAKELKEWETKSNGG